MITYDTLIYGLYKVGKLDSAIIDVQVVPIIWFGVNCVNFQSSIAMHGHVC